jgi:V8-like Glu-specific endopeptidase
LKRLFLTSVVCFLSLIFLSFPTFAKNKVIYGQNGLRTPEQIPLYDDLVGSTAAMVANYRLQLQADGHFRYMAHETNFCAGEPLNHQKRLAKCSGFLVGEDILVTAGHCMLDQVECENNSWVFDYNRDVQESGIIEAEQVYRCKQVLFAEKNIQTKVDFAIIRLDHKVTGRLPMPLHYGKVDSSQQLMAIGFPFGTFLKLSINGSVRDNSNPFYFQANLDTFHGNSGSPIINQNTGEVEGLLVRGEKDTYLDQQNSCLRINHCRDGQCRGEDVIRISVVIKKLHELGLNF